MKNKLVYFFILFTISIRAQWTSFTQPFSPYNASMNSINVGSANQLVGIADDIYGSPYKMAYKYDFNTESWYLYHDLWPYNLGFASVAADGTVWTAELNGNGLYKNTVAKTGPVMKVIQSRSSTEAMGYNPTQTFFTGNNMNISNASDVFTLQTTTSQINMKSIDIGDDGTIWGVNNNPPPYYSTALYKFVSGDWVEQTTGTTFTDWESVAVADNEKVLAVRAGLLYYKDPVSGNFLRDFSAPASVTQASIAADGTVFILATQSNNSNVYKNTWSGILCGVIPTPTYAAGDNNQYICPGNTATFTASGSGTLNWYDSPSSSTILGTGNTFTTPATSSDMTYYVENNVGSCKSPRVPMYVSMSATPNDPVNTTPSANLTICPGQATTLTASAPANGSTENRWYATNSGTPSLGSGNSFTVPAGAVNASTTYYIQAYKLNNGCVSNYVPVTITVSPAPSAPVNTTAASNATICSNESTTLSVSGSGTINWYSDMSATNLVHSGTDYATPSLTNSTTYYTRIMGGSCNSAITSVPVTVNQPSYGTHTVSTCSSYQWIDGQTYNTSNSTATYTLQNSLGCDSIVTLNLTINQPSANTISAQACNSYEWNGQTYTTGGSYSQTFSNIHGCDSVVTLNLTVSQPSSSTLTESSCGSYTLNGQTYATTGVYTQTISNSQGCDSTITLQLTVLNPSSSVLTEQACSSYELNGTTYTASGTYFQTISNAQGCDSTITLHLTLNNNSSDFTESACTSYEWNNQIYTASGSYQQIFTNSAGCDSTVTLNLTIDAMPSDAVSQTNTTLTAAQSGMQYQWIDCNNNNAPLANQTAQSFTPAVSGSYAVIISNGDCSLTSACTSVTISTNGIGEWTNAEWSVYPNPTNTSVTIANLPSNSVMQLLDESGRVIQTKPVTQNTFDLNVSALQNGLYFVQIQTTNGSVSTKKLIKQ